MVWTGADLQDSGAWITELHQKEIDELRTAVNKARSSAKPLARQSRDDFKFRLLGERLTRLKIQLNEGMGFTLINGDFTNGWTDQDLIYAYWGIGTWLGHALPQNAQAHLLGHVIDQRQEHKPGTRVYQTNQAQPFHSDSCDLVGLLCLRAAKSGGASAVASSAAIFNDLLAQNHPVLETLHQVFYCDRFGEIPAGKKSHYPIRVFNNIDNRIVCCGMDPDIRSAQRLKEVPRLDRLQQQALDAFQASASRLAVNMQLQRGDMQFVNNLVAVHARTAFEDFVDSERRRYLIRLWLSVPEGRRLPEFMAERWGTIEPGKLRGGIRVPGAEPSVQFHP